jgi:hypothetical protein
VPEQNQEKPVPVFNLADRVRIRHSRGMRGRIVELRGALGPGGCQVYRVRIFGRAQPSYIEVTEDQLERLPTKV